MVKFGRLLAACVAGLAWSVQATGQTIAPDQPIEVSTVTAQELMTQFTSSDNAAVENQETTQVENPSVEAPETALAVEFVDVLIEGQTHSVRTRLQTDGTREYDLSDIAQALRSRVDTRTTVLGYFRFQDGVVMTLDMADGKVRADKVVLGKLPGFQSRSMADHWVDINAVAVLTGTHASEDADGRTVLSLDDRLRPQFGLDLWVSGAPVDVFGVEPRTIGPVLLVPLEPVADALGHELDRVGNEVTVTRSQDQARITLDLSTGLVTVNGLVRGTAPDIQFAETDELILPSSAVETLTGTHIKLKPGSSRVEVRLDDRLSSTALPGERIDTEVSKTGFTPETLAWEVSDRGPLRAELGAHWGNFNTVTRVETAGGIGSFAGSQPAWMSIDVKSLDGWAGTAGDYNAAYRELSGIDQNRIRGVSWRKQRDDGSVLAIAAGTAQTGSTVTNDNTASVPEFGGVVGGIRLTSKNQDQDIGVAFDVSESGDQGRVVLGGQKDFQIEDKDKGLRSAYVAADIGAFDGYENSVDVRARAALAYALNPQVGLRANASYDGASFQTSPSSNEGVFDQRVGAKTAVSVAADWRADAPIGAIHYLSAGVNGSWTQTGPDKDSSTTIAANVSGQLGERGPRVNVSLSNQSSDGGEDKQTLRVRAFQKLDWASITANYTQTNSNSEETQQLTANVQTKPYRKTWQNQAGVSIAPALGLNWNGDDTRIQAGVSAIVESGRAFGERFSVLARYSALTDFASERDGVRHFANVQARYRITDRIELTTIYSDDFNGNSDVSIGLRGVMSFNPPRRHSKPNDGAGVLTGRVFLDKNRDGIRQDDEPGIPGIRVMIGRGLGLNTAYEGAFTIQNLKAGLYPINVDKRSLPLGYLVAEESIPRVTIGEGRRTDVNVPLILSGQIRGSLFVDDNADGAITPGEKRMEGVWIRLIPKSGGEVRVTHSASFGQFGFENVIPDDYVLEANIAGQVIKRDITVNDEVPFIKEQVPIPPDLLLKGSGPDLDAGVIGEP